MKGAQPSSRSGVTLFEFVAVTFILAILGTLAYAAVPAALERQRVGKARGELALVAAALEAYQARHGSYPRRPDDATNMNRYLFNALNGKFAPDGASIQGEPLLNNASLRLETGALPNPETSEAVDNRIIDPWGAPYRYDYDPGAEGWDAYGYELYSAGPDGTDNTEDDIDFAE